MSGPLELGPLSLGCAPLGDLYRRVTDEEVADLVDLAFARGVRCFDTAPHYGYGRSEARLGAALAGRPRHSFVVSTKVGRDLRPVAEVPHLVDPHDIFVDPPPVRSVFAFSADAVRRQVETSLERLGLDRLDLVHVHDPDDHLDEAVAGAYPALVRLRDEGVVGAIGLGTNHAWVGEHVLERVDLDWVLLAGRVTLLDASGAERLLPACADRGVGVLAAGVFNSGLLADPRPGAPFHYAPAPPDVLARAQRLAEVCRAHGTTLAAAALHRPTREPAVASVLVGASTAAELAEDLDLLAAPLPDALWPALTAAGAA